MGEQPHNGGGVGDGDLDMTAAAGSAGSGDLPQGGHGQQRGRGEAWSGWCGGAGVGAPSRGTVCQRRGRGGVPLGHGDRDPIGAGAGGHALVGIPSTGWQRRRERLRGGGGRRTEGEEWGQVHG